MGTLFTSLAVSLDGFIAARSGDQSWLNNAMVRGEDYGFDATMKRTGIYVMGANTYREMLNSGAAGRKDSAPIYVVTHGTDLSTGTQTHLYSGDLKNLTELVKSRTDKDVYVWGGGNLISQLIDLDLLEELNIAVMPVVLGDGVPLFGRISRSKKLALAACQAFETSGIVLLKYKLLPTARSRKSAAEPS